MESTASKSPATGRVLPAMTQLRPLNRDHALQTVRRARTHVEGDRFSKRAIELRDRHFAYLKKLYD